MKAIKIIAALSAAVIMSACAADQPSVIEPPVVSVPQSSPDEQTSVSDPVEASQTTSVQDSVPDETKETVEPVGSAAETAEPVPSAETAEVPEVTTTMADTTAAIVTEAPFEETEEPDPVAYGAYQLTAEEMEFVERSVFVGDSICKGFGTYNIISFDHVYANGSMGTRNFDKYPFTYKNKEVTFDELLTRTKPELLFLSMGMNDINMIHPDDYRRNYARIIDRALSESEAVVYLCAMTPVRSNFTSNERVDYFNNELEELAQSYPERVYYVNYGRLLLNDRGLLNNQLDGGDGVHLSPYAYRIALWEIHRTLVEDGTLYPNEMNSTAEATEEVEVSMEPVQSEEASTEAVPTVESAQSTAESADSHETQSAERIPVE